MAPKRRWKSLDIEDDLKNAGLVDFEVLQTASTKERKLSGRVPSEESTTEEKLETTSDSGEDVEQASQESGEQTAETSAAEEDLDEEEADTSSPTDGWISWNLRSIAFESEEKRARIIQCAEAFRLDRRLLLNIKKLGWSQPTEIQSRVVPLSIVTRRDVCIASETGSGKTGAFALPVLQHLLGNKKDPKALRCLVLAPSRELAEQVHKVFQLLAEETGVKTLCVVGGVSIEKQERLLDRQPDIIVGTVGRMSALTFGDTELQIWPHKSLTTFKHLTHLIVDEADRMLEAGKARAVRCFFDKLIKDNDGQRGKCQIIVASATLMMMRPEEGNGKGHLDFIPFRSKQCEIVDLTNKTGTTVQKAKTLGLKMPKGLIMSSIKIAFEDRDKWLYLTISKMMKEHQHSSSYKILVFANSIGYVSKATSLMSLIFYKDLHDINAATPAKSASKRRDKREEVDSSSTSSRGVALLRAMMKKPVSGEARPDEDEAGCEAECDEGLKPKQKKKAKKSQHTGVRLQVPIYSLHSKMKQKSRYKAIEAFSQPDHSCVLIATDVAARGLDFPAVDLVVHLQAPRTAQTLAHRCGRTARGPNGHGETLFFVTPEENEIYREEFTTLGLVFDALQVWEPSARLTPHEHREVRALLALADSIETSEHRIRRDKQERNWLHNTCEKAEMVFDSDEAAWHGDQSDSEQAAFRDLSAGERRSVAATKSQKKALLSMLEKNQCLHLSV